MGGIKSGPKSLTTLEEAVMLTMRKKARYGLEIIERVYQASNENHDINIGTLYPLLKRLTCEGLITSVSKPDALKNRGGHGRKYYELTSSGKEALESAEQLRQNLRSLDEEDNSDYCSGVVFP